MNYFPKKILFVLIAIFSCITLGLSSFNSSPTSLNTSVQSLSPRTAATSNYNLDLNITWGYSGSEVGEGIALDDSGNIYISGSVDSFGWGNDDVLFGKFNKAGDSIFNINWGGSNEDFGYDIALDDSGNIYITGATSSFGSGVKDAFIAKYDRFGLLQWSTIWGGSDMDYGYGIALDDLGNIYITGRTYSFGPAGNNAFIAKFDSAGNSLDNITWGGGNDDYGRNIAINGTDIYITGGTKSYNMFDAYDAFIAKFNSTGDSIMNITWTSPFFVDDNGYDIVLDDSGNIYITGQTNTTGTLDDDAFIAKFNSTGHSKMNITWDGGLSDDSFGIALDDSGNIYITGIYEDPVTSLDIFIAKFDSTGNSKANITWGGGALDLGRDIAIDGSGSIYVTGFTQSHGNGIQAFIVKYKPIVAVGGPAPDDDDDDDTDTSVMVRYISIIILASIGTAVAVIYILIKKGVITSTKVKR